VKLSGLSCLDSGTSGCSMDPLVISRTVVCSRAYVNLFILAGGGALYSY